MKGYDTCYGHRPDLAEERRRSASKGGQAGGRGRSGSYAGELAEVKREIRAVISNALSGETERGVAAVVFQGYNALLKAVETERKIREQEEIIERLEALEQAASHKKGGRWGA